MLKYTFFIKNIIPLINKNETSQKTRKFNLFNNFISLFEVCALSSNLKLIPYHFTKFELSCYFHKVLMVKLH